MLETGNHSDGQCYLKQASCNIQVRNIFDITYTINYDIYIHIHKEDCLSQSMLTVFNLQLKLCRYRKRTSQVWSRR